MSRDDSPDKPLVYPRITPEYLESLIISEEYFHSEVARISIIVVILEGGLTEFETAMCGSSQKYDEQIGRSKARQKLMTKLQDKEYFAMRRYIHMQAQKAKGQGNE